MDLRFFEPTDLPTLVEIDRSCFPPGIAYSREELEDFIGQPNSRTWVAVEGESIIGFLVADLQPDRVGHIITIDVIEDWRRRRVGTVLMGAAEDWARSGNARQIYLETAEDNLLAQSFYHARGYAMAQKIPHYYSNGTAAWVMVKSLEEKLRVESANSKLESDRDP